MNSDLKDYTDILNYIYGLQKHGIKLGLSNTQSLMEILGMPHTSFRSVHIAGTNGKGSTAAMIASILHESGCNVGLFTSPHLVSFTERIRINNRQITGSEVMELAMHVKNAVSNTDLNPTFFEFVTAMGFYYFAQQKVDWAVIETGMGGRLDATNIVRPDMTVITNIGLDHSEFLGNNIMDITCEKAGIIKSHVPLVTAAVIPEVIMKLEEIAREHGADIHIYDRDFRGTLHSMDHTHIAFDYEGVNSFKNLTLPLSGRYQLYNACTAVRACELLMKRNTAVSDSSIKEGLQNTSLEGRLELLSGTPPIIVDGAHNPEAAKAVAEAVKEVFPGKKTILLSGVMNDKDIRGIIHHLLRISEEVILTKPKYERAADTSRIRDIILSMDRADAETPPVTVHCTESVAEALRLAKKLCTKDHIILVSGSFYTAGEVKEILGYPAVLTKLRE